jgi:solute carrier family 25 carnitine/acylcarnitine transporter 20/29
LFLQKILGMLLLVSDLSLHCRVTLYCFSLFGRLTFADYILFCFHFKGVCSVLVGHPFDLVKVRQQTADSKEKPSGTIATIRAILKSEGIGGLYRGVGAPIIAVAPIWATSFWGFDTGDKLVRAVAGLSPDARLSLLQLCAAGGFSALPTVLVMVPSERIKCILQTQSNSKTKQYNGVGDCARAIMKEEGIINGLYKGTALTLMRDIPGNMVYFGVYEIVKNQLGGNSAAAFLAGACAGISLWPVILPMDCLKSRYQTAPEGKYKNMAEVYKGLVEEDGYGGFFRGIGPAMLRSAPANAVSFLGAELTKSALGKFM